MNEGIGFVEADLAVLEKEAFGEPILARLAQMRSLAASQEWEKVLRLLAPLRFALRRVDRRLAEQATRILFGRIIHAASELDNLDDVERLVGAFTRVAEPMAIDPSWNRFWAIAWDESSCEETSGRWLKYVDDLESIPAFTATERPLAQAMVLSRMAMQYRDQAEARSFPRSNLMPSEWFEEPDDESESNELKMEVIKCLERSIELAPLYLPAHRMLIDAHKRRNNTTKCEAAATRLLAAAPEDLETLEFMLESAMERDDHDAAMAFVRRARALKPLDQSLRDREWTIRVGLARKCAIAGRWDEGREQFRAADELLPDHCGRYDYLACKLLFEAKAGRRDESDRFLLEAQAKLPEPTPLWLSLAIEASRYGMTHATQHGYAELWLADLKKKCRSETAGAMAHLLHSYRFAKIDFPGRDGYIAHLAGYLQRTSRLKYRQIDIERVCDFLIGLREHQKLLDKLLKHGLKLHAGSVWLHYHAGAEALASSRPPLIGHRALEHLETALKLAEASSVASETELVPSIKQTLTMIKEFNTRLGLGIFGGGGPFSFPGSDDESFDFFNDDAFGDGFDDDRDFDDHRFDRDPRSIPSSGPTPKKKKARKKR